MNYVIYNLSCWKPKKLWTRLLSRFCYHRKFLYFWNNFDENWFYENGWNYVQQTATCFWGVFRWNTTWRISHYQQVRPHNHLDILTAYTISSPTQFLEIFFRHTGDHKSFLSPPNMAFHVLNAYEEDNTVGTFL